MSKPSYACVKCNSCRCWPNKCTGMRFEVITVLNINIKVWWDVRPCSSVNRYQSFEGNSCLYHQEEYVLNRINQWKVVKAKFGFRWKIINMINTNIYRPRSISSVLNSKNGIGKLREKYFTWCEHRDHKTRRSVNIVKKLEENSLVMLHTYI